jgi:hypothetical protein
MVSDYTFAFPVIQLLFDFSPCVILATDAQEIAAQRTLRQTYSIHAQASPTFRAKSHMLEGQSDAGTVVMDKR